jgi:HK97 family phage major capsid protein
MKKCKFCGAEFTGDGDQCPTCAARISALVSEEVTRIQNAAKPKTDGVVIPDGAKITVGVDHATEAPWHLHEFGRFMNSVRLAGQGHPELADKRLFNAATTFAAEGVGADGGFATPVEFDTKITTLLKETYAWKLIGMFAKITTTSNNRIVPVDATTPWGTSDGQIVTWDGEGAQMTARKPKIREIVLRLHRLGILVPITRELEQDGLDVSGHISRISARNMGYGLLDAIINGNGTNQPQGLINSASYTAIAKSSGHASGTYIYSDAASQWDVMTPEMREQAVWIANPRIQGQLRQFTIGSYQSAMTEIGAAGQQLGVDYLFRRPVFYTEAMKGTPGLPHDIVLVDPLSYMLLMKAQGVEYAVSTEFLFDQNMNTHRMILRVDGRSMMQETWTAPDGTAVLSNIIGVASRA